MVIGWGLPLLPTTIESVQAFVLLRTSGCKCPKPTWAHELGKGNVSRGTRIQFVSLTGLSWPGAGSHCTLLKISFPHFSCNWKIMGASAASEFPSSLVQPKIKLTLWSCLTTPFTHIEHLLSLVSRVSPTSSHRWVVYVCFGLSFKVLRAFPSNVILQAYFCHHSLLRS